MKLGNDDFTELHFRNWLANHVALEERDEVEKNIRAYCARYPDAQDGHASWPDLRDRAEKETA